MRHADVRARWWKQLLAGSFGLALGCTNTDAYRPEKTIATWPAEAIQTDRQLIHCPMAQQARNGAIVEATLFNYHYRLDYENLLDDGSVLRRSAPLQTAELMPAGTNLIQRLARRHASGAEFWLFVQTANDVPFDPRKPEASAKKRHQLNDQRLKAVEEYVSIIRPDLIARVVIIDSDEVGMSGSEAVKGLSEMINSAQGILRSDNYDPRQVGGGGGGGMPGGPIGPGGPGGPAPMQPDPGSAPGGLSPGP